MATYIEYTLDDGSTLLIEADDSSEGMKKAADVSGNVIIKAEKMFKDALSSVRQSVATLQHDLAALDADDVEVTFGIRTVGELGVFAVCKVGGEMNYEVKLRWARKEQKQ